MITTSPFSFETPQKRKREEATSTRNIEKASPKKARVDNDRNPEVHHGPITDRHMAFEYLKRLHATTKEIKKALGLKDAPQETFSAEWRPYGMGTTLKNMKNNVLQLSYANYISDLAKSKAHQDKLKHEKLTKLVAKKTKELKALFEVRL